MKKDEKKQPENENEMQGGREVRREWTELKYNTCNTSTYMYIYVNHIYCKTQPHQSKNYSHNVSQLG